MREHVRMFEIRDPEKMKTSIKTLKFIRNIYSSNSKYGVTKLIATTH